MSRTAIKVRLDGWAPASLVGAHSPPTWETVADGGIGEISLEFGRSARAGHQLLRRHTLIEVLYGAQPVATGRITDFDRASGQVKAQGLSTVNLTATDANGNATRDVGMAVAAARTKGWPVRVGPGVHGIASGDIPNEPHLGALLTDFATERALRWGVTGDRVLYVRPDPTAPKYRVAPGRAAFAASSDGVTTHLVARYQTGSGLGTLSWPPSGVVRGEQPVDLTSRGPLTPTQVGAILGAMLALSRGRPRWESGVTLHRSAITSNGEPAVLPLVTAGTMLRATGVPQDMQLGGGMFLDVVIGKTTYTAGSEEIYVEPVNTAAHDLTGVLAEG